MSSRWSPEARQSGRHSALHASRSLQRDGVRRERPGRHRSAFQWPAELREWRLYLWFGGHGGQGARGARVAAQAATVGRAANAPARGRRLCLAAPRRRRHCHGHACRRTAQAPPAPTVEEAEIATLSYVGFRPQVPDLLRLRDGTRRWPGIYPVGSGTAGSSPPRGRRSPTIRCLRGSPRLPERVGDRSVDHRAQIVVLASLTVELRERPRAGERHVVAAWPVGSDGRKHHSASALYDAMGRVLAVADASGSSYETPPRSAAEPRDSLLIVRSLLSRLSSPDHGLDRQVKRGGDETCLLGLLGSRRSASSAASVASASRRASSVRISKARS